MERLKEMKRALVSCAESQVQGNLNGVNAEELGEVIDMIKDLEEAIYYCSITEAMEESKEEEEFFRKHKDLMPKSENKYYDGRRRNYLEGRMYYDGSMGETPMHYTETYPTEIRDVREGKSPVTRKNYMESKELHQGKEKQMKELEKYMKELCEDITEMVEDASPEEKMMLSQKLNILADKIK